MSINAKPWEGGGAASVPDASETTKGKIRIATSAEATTGTDDLTAMTPLTVKERIDAAIAGGIEYKTTFNATTGLPSLANAEKGDLYKISTAGTIYGRDWAVGDHLIINEDMGGTISNGKIDKVDNTESPASESVAGVVALATNAEATAASATNKALVPSNISSIDLSSFDNDLSADDFAADHVASHYTPANGNIDGHLSGIDSALASVGGNQITDVSSQTGSTFTATANEIYVVGYTTGTQTITFPDASASTDGDLIGLTSTGPNDYSLDLVSSDGSTNDLMNMSNQDKGGTLGALSLTVKQELILFACDGTKWRQLSRELADVAKTGAYSDLSGTPTLATVATTGAYSDLSGTPTLATVATTGAYSDLSGTPTLATVATTGAYSDLSGTPTLGTAAALDVGTSANNVVQLDGSSRLPAVDGSQLTNLPSSGATDLDGLSDVTITTPTSSGQILRNNGAGQFVNVALSIVDDTTPQLGGNLDPNGFGVSANLVPSTANNISLGTASAEWSDLYIGDSGKIFFGNDQDVELIHDPDNGLRLDLGVAESSNDPQLELRSQNSGTIGPRIKFNHESASPAAGDRIGNISFNGEDSGGTTQDYSQIVGKIVDPTAGAEAGSVSIMPYPGMANNRGLHVEGVAGQVTQVKVNIDHDGGNYGLHLNNTLVTTTAAELNLLDGGSTVGSSITITDTDGFIINDGGVSKLIPASDIKTYAASGATGISSVSEDLDPTLGGDLKVAGYAITSTSNGDVTINPDGTGDISVGADIVPDADNTHTLGSEDNRFITLHSELNGAVQFKARNETGGPLTKGQAVYISGVSGDVPLVSLARANSASTMPAHGLLAADVSNNADVQVISFGNLTAYNTTTHSLSLGDTVYVSAATAGALTSSAPAGETNLIQNIGKVVRASATEGIIKVGGAGRSAATPNLDNGKIFLGNGSNQAVSTALSSAAVTSFNTQTGALTIGGDDLTADHTASNYTPANANIDGHLSGIDDELLLKAPLASPSLTGTPTAPTATQGDNSTQLATTAYVDTAVSAGGGGVDPTLTVVSSTTYTLSAANAPGIHIWYGASNGSTFTVTMPDIANVLSTAVSVNGDPGPTFEVYIGRGQAGDITVSAADGIDLLGDGSISYSTTQTVDSGQWVKLVGWYSSASTQRYLMDSAAQPRDAGLTSISGLTTAADKMIYTTGSDTYAVTDLTAAGRAILDDADATAQRSTLGLGSAATEDVGTGANNVVQLDGSSRLPAVDGSQLTNLPSGGATDLDGLSDVTITTPTSSGQILRNNGSGQFVNVALSIVDDPTPQLGGDLDVNANEIVSASNNNVVIRPNGTGHVFLGGNTNPAEVRLYCESSDAHYVGFKSAAHADYGTSVVWELPAGDGSPNQILETDGSGVLSWVDQAGAGGAPPLTTASPSSTYAITDTSSVYQIYLLTPTADVDVTLPSATSAGSGARYDVKNLSSSYTLTLKGQTGDNIDGVAPTTGIILGTQYESLTVVSDGSDWFII